MVKSKTELKKTPKKPTSNTNTNVSINMNINIKNFSKLKENESKDALIERIQSNIDLMDLTKCIRRKGLRSFECKIDCEEFMTAQEPCSIYENSLKMSIQRKNKLLTAAENMRDKYEDCLYFMQKRYENSKLYMVEKRNERQKLISEAKGTDCYMDQSLRSLIGNGKVLRNNSEATGLRVGSTRTNFESEILQAKNSDKNK